MGRAAKPLRPSLRRSRMDGEAFAVRPHKSHDIARGRESSSMRPAWIARRRLVDRSREGGGGGLGWSDSRVGNSLAGVRQRGNNAEAVDPRFPFKIGRAHV